jgi:hypothetical protein
MIEPPIDDPHMAAHQRMIRNAFVMERNARHMRNLAFALIVLTLLNLALTAASLWLRFGTLSQ